MANRGDRQEVQVMVQVGDRIEIESEKVGSPIRGGVVVEVDGRLLRVRWDSGTESTYVPSAGAMRVVGRAEEGEKA
jgi:hypothetical protein